MATTPTEQVPVRHLSDTDLHHLTRSGWIPTTNIDALEALRLRHEELIEQRDALTAEAGDLRRKYDTEDRAAQAALDEAYRTGQDIDAPDVTPTDERVEALIEADAHARAAGRAVMAFAREALDTLRGSFELPPSWNPYIAAQEQKVPPGGLGATLLAGLSSETTALQEQIEQARRAMAEAELRLREYAPLRHWIAKNSNGEHGQIEPGTDLPVPTTHTLMSKPVDAAVDGWWEGAEGDTVPDDAEAGVIDTSDPEVLARFDK